jgi:peptide/nickel transport system permease protein
MRRYIAQRAIGLAPLLLGISLVIFAIVHLAPGGPLAVYAFSPDFSPELQAQIERNLGLDQPMHIQYLCWLQGMLTGDWGRSYKDARAARDVIFERLPATLLLMGASFLFSQLIAIPAGIYNATRRPSRSRYLVNIITMIGISVPTFWTGLLAIMVLSGQLGLIPSGGMFTIGRPFSLPDLLGHLITPMLVLAVVNIAVWARYTHSTLIEILQEDYIRTARAKGLRERIVILRHGFKNALLVIVTLLGLSLPGLLSGALVTEAVFSWPGNGRLIIESLLGRNYPVLMGDFMILAVLAVLGNFFADVTYALIDPRIRFEAHE